MKILVTSFTFPPQANGVAEIARAQASLLARRGHEVSVATGYDQARTEADGLGLFPVHQFRIEGDFDPRVGYQGEIEAYRKFLASSSADIMVFNCWQNWCVDVALPMFVEFPSRQVMVSQGFSAHRWYPQKRFPWGVARWLRSRAYVRKLPTFLRAFDHLVFLSERQDRGRFFDFWLTRRLGLRHYSVIPNGIHLGDLTKPALNFRERYGIPASDFLLLNVANYCDRKNQIAALRAFCHLRRDDVTLVFIGSERNDYSKLMFNFLKRHPRQAAKVQILQNVPKAHINAAYAEADLFVFSSKEETQPLAVLDAMGAGLPFISTNAGCVSEFPGGIIVNSERRMTKAIEELLADRDRSHRLGEEGRAAAYKSYCWERIIADYEQCFERLLENGTAQTAVSGRTR